MWYQHSFSPHHFSSPFVVRLQGTEEMDKMFLLGEGVFKIISTIPVLEKTGDKKHPLRYHDREKACGIVNTKQDFDEKVSGLYSPILVHGSIHSRIAYAYGCFLKGESVLKYTFMWRRLGTSEWKKWFEVERNVPMPVAYDGMY